MFKRILFRGPLFLSLIGRAIVVLIFILLPAMYIVIYWGWHSLSDIQSELRFGVLVPVTILGVLILFGAGFWLIRGADFEMTNRHRVPYASKDKLDPRDSADTIPAEISKLADEADYIITDYPAGEERNERLDVVMGRMREIVQSSPYDVSTLIPSESPGRRLAAIMKLQIKPEFEHIEWLAKRITAERLWLGLQAAIAILSAARLGDSSKRYAISTAIDPLVSRDPSVLDSTDPRRLILDQVSKEIWGL